MECAFAGGTSYSYALTVGAAGTLKAQTAAVGTAATASGAAAAGASLTAGAGIAGCAAALAPWAPWAAAALAPAAAVAVGLHWALCGMDAKGPAEEAEFVMYQAQGAVPCTMLLGEGRFGKVYQVGTSDGHVVKRTKADASLQGLGGDVIIPFYGHCVIKNETFIFMERCSGSLQGRSFGETDAACLVCQLFRALQHVHLMRLLHKPASCLVKAWAGAVASWKVRLSDFGCSCGFSSAATCHQQEPLHFGLQSSSLAKRLLHQLTFGQGLQRPGLLPRERCLPPLKPFIF
ncbi:unnamed protein product [Durusdinium trenchii]|uniref:Protein kinase domain-containing protein n=1 Tax=Durusdinium trenchii TaxID=1381693 RepID=A0ABP0LTF2_9DINO